MLELRYALFLCTKYVLRGGVRLLLLRLRIIQFTINQLIVFIIIENIIEYQPCVLFHYPVEKTESQESLLPSQFCSFLRLAAKNNSHHFHKEDSFFSVGPSFFLITGEPEQGGQEGVMGLPHFADLYRQMFVRSTYSCSN